jgi:hypothetical protein
LYKKIKREKTIDNISPVRHTSKGLVEIDRRLTEHSKTVENKHLQRKGEASMCHIPEDVQLSLADTPMHTRPIDARKTSPPRNLPRHLPSLTFKDAAHDGPHDYEGPYNFDNPRYSIPAARGRIKDPIPSSAVGGQQQQCQSAVESLPVTIMDIANASPKIRKSKHGEWLFNTDEDVQKFRNLLRDSPPRTLCRNLDNLNHTNFCDKEKTKWILDWIREVDHTQAREGYWPETGTDQIAGDGKHR